MGNLYGSQTKGFAADVDDKAAACVWKAVLEFAGNTPFLPSGLNPDIRISITKGRVQAPVSIASPGNTQALELKFVV